MRQAMGCRDDVPLRKKWSRAEGPLHPFGFLLRGLGNRPSTTNPRPSGITVMTARVAALVSNGGGGCFFMSVINAIDFAVLHVMDFLWAIG